MKLFPQSSWQMSVALGLALALVGGTAESVRAFTDRGAGGSLPGSECAPVNLPRLSELAKTALKAAETAKKSVAAALISYTTGGTGAVSTDVSNSSGNKIVNFTLNNGTSGPRTQLTVQSLLPGAKGATVFNFKTTELATKASAIINGTLTSLIQAGASPQILQLALSVFTGIDTLSTPTAMEAQFASNLARLLTAYARLGGITTAAQPSPLLFASVPGLPADVFAPLMLAEAKADKVDVVALNEALSAYNDLVQTTPLEFLAVLSENPEFKQIGSELQRLNVAAGAQYQQK
jgi:hypothetical protein